MLNACQRAAPPPPLTQPQTPPAAAVTAWSRYRDSFIESYFKAHPTVAATAGRHEFDGQLPDWSKTGIAAEVARLHGERDKATAFDAQSLSEAERFERDVLVAHIDRDLFWEEVAQAPFNNPVFYNDILDTLDPSLYLTRNYAPLEQRMKAYVAYARAIPQAAQQIEANLHMPLPRPLLERGAAAMQGFADFYRDDVPKVFRVVQDPKAQADFNAANHAAIAAMTRLAGWLHGNLRTANGSFALGSGKFARLLLMTEGVDTPLPELEKIGRADLQRNLAALREACRQFLPGQPLARCTAKMQAMKPQDGSVAAARAQLGQLKAFVVQSGIVAVPGTEEALVREAPPFNRANFAYIDIPGPYETGLPSIYYIAPPDPAWPEKERRDYLPGRADLLFTSVHEVWPGHFLQFLHSNRNPSPVARLFVGYGFAEGWAHYAEEMMWEVGLDAGDAESHIGQLTNALLRDVRFLSAIGMHTGHMTVAQSEKLFRDNAFSNPGEARQQAQRGTYDPAYLNYTLGKLMIRKLRADWCAPRGGKAAWRDFHDRFLSYGGPPIPLVRKAMLGSGGALF